MRGGTEVKGAENNRENGQKVQGRKWSRKRLVKEARREERIGEEEEQSEERRGDADWK